MNTGTGSTPVVYGEGDLIIYGGTGVCRVEKVAAHDLRGGGGHQYHYILRPLYQDCVISAPADSGKVYMRPVISKEEAERLIDMIPSIQAEAYHNRVLSRLTEHYQSAMRTCDCGELIELTMSIYEKKRITEQQKRKFGAVDERFMKRAEELLFGELAVALSINKEDVSAYIEKRIETERKEDHNGT